MTPEQKAEQKREQNRRYLERLRADPERYAKRIAKTREWQERNPESYKRSKKKWNERNPEYYRDWHARHPDYYQEYRAKHALELAAYQREWRAKVKAQKPPHPCLHCGAETQNAKYCSHVCCGKASQASRKK